MFPFTIVRSLSKIDEYDECWMSVETSGSSVYCRIPSNGPLSAFERKSSFTSSLRRLAADAHDQVDDRAGRHGRAHRHAVDLALQVGHARARSRCAAPVEVGIRLIAAARARRRSSCGRSSTRWSFVYAWIVVMKPCSIVNSSCSTLASGATQLVVQEAFEITSCASGS